MDYSAKKPKRFRSAFTTQQIDILEQQFKKTQYITGEHRKQLAFMLNIQERAVKIWFQNRRMRKKNDDIKENGDGTKHKQPQRQLNNVCTLSSTNDQSSLKVMTKPLVVQPVNEDDAVCLKSKDKTNMVVSHVFEPSAKVDDKHVCDKQKTKTLVLSHFMQPSVNVYNKPYVIDKQKAKSQTDLSNFFEQYKYSPPPSLPKPTAANTTDKSTVSITNKHPSALTNSKSKKLSGNDNLYTEAILNVSGKKLSTKIKSLSKGKGSSDLKTILKKKKISRSCTQTMQPVDVQKPTYVPVMQTMYSPIPPTSTIVWKPVNYLSIPGTPVNSYSMAHATTSQPIQNSTECCRNCTNVPSSSPVYNPGVNIYSPYHQYVLPFQTNNPNF